MIMEDIVLDLGQFSVSLKDMGKELYVFNSESGTGKTYLRKVLEKCHVYGKPVSAYSYETALLGLRPLDVCKPTDKLVVLDRYEMYQDEYDDDVCTLAENTCVLADTKICAFLPVPYRLCTLHMDGPNVFRIVGG